MLKKLFSIILGLLSSMGFASAAYDYNSCPMGSGMMYGLAGTYGSTMMFFSWVLFLLIVTLIIAAIYWLIKSSTHMTKTRR